MSFASFKSDIIKFPLEIAGYKVFFDQKQIPQIRKHH